MAFALLEPLIRVIIEMPTSPTRGRASQLGILRGGFAPRQLARYGSHSATGAGSSSTMS